MPNNRKKIWGIVPAAGIGRRMKIVQPKQYLLLHNRPMILHTLEKLCNSGQLDGIVVGIRKEDTFWRKLNFAHPLFLGASEGGTERMNTVLNAIKFLFEKDITKEDDWVLIHDAVRPCIVQSDIKKVVNCALANGAGALLGSRVADTLKEVDENNRVIRTVSRDRYWRALTPQIFPLGTFKSALEQCIDHGMIVTDESVAIEKQGIHPEFVESSLTNLKITYKIDLWLAEMFMTEVKQCE